MSAIRWAAPILAALVMIVSGCGNDGASETGATGTDAARFCEITAELEEARQRFVQADSSESKNAEAFENYLSQEMTLGAEAISVVPAEIRSDFEAVMDREAALLPVYEAAGYYLLRADADALQAAKDQHPVPPDARQRIGDWTDSNC